MLLRATLKYLPAQVLAPVAQLVSMVVWTHWLAPAQMGAFTLIATTQELAYLVCLSWFSVYTLRTLPGTEGDPATRQRYLRTENAVVGAACALLALIGLLCAPGLAGGDGLGRTGASIAVFIVTRALNAHYAERARAQASTAAYTLLQSVGPVGGLALGLAALQFVRPGADVLWLSYAAAQALGTALALPRLGMTAAWRRPDRAVLRAALGFGGPMLGLSALGWIAENHLRYLIEWRAGAVTLGLMAVGWGLGRRCASVASMLVSTAAFPIAARLLNEGRRDEAMVQLRLNAALLLGVTLPVAVGLAFIGPAIVALTVAPAYREATSAVLGLSVLSGAMRCLHVHVTDQCLVLDKHFRLAATINVVEIAACAAASLAGFAGFGIAGAVAGQGVGSALALALSARWARTRSGLRWPGSDTLRIGLATAAMGTMLGTTGAMQTVAAVLGHCAAAAAVYLLAIVACYRPMLAAQARTLRRTSSAMWKSGRNPSLPPRFETTDAQQ